VKSELAAELCSVIAFSAIQNNDKVGMLTFTDRVEKFIPPRKGMRHVLRVIREALYNKPQGAGTDIKDVLENLNRVTTRSTITFVISDFFAPEFRKTLSITNKRHDVIAVTITDPSEIELPDAGIIKLHDAETGEPYVIDSSDARIRKAYAEKAHAMMEERKALFRSTGVDNIDLRTDQSYVEPLIRFFRMRERRLKR
jgi:uncharacterized protein (DUF58 family)